MAKRKPRTVVSLRALIRRINRKLVSEGKRVKRLRADKWQGQRPEYILFDEHRNVVIGTRIDVQSLGRELHVLEDSERVVQDLE